VHPNHYIKILEYWKVVQTHTEITSPLCYFCTYDALKTQCWKFSSTVRGTARYNSTLDSSKYLSFGVVANTRKTKLWYRIVYQAGAGNHLELTWREVAQMLSTSYRVCGVNCGVCKLEHRMSCIQWLLIPLLLWKKQKSELQIYNDALKWILS